MNKTIAVCFSLLISCNLSAAVLTADTTTTIQAVIENAVNGDEIQVQPGYYVENINFLDKEINLVAIEGPSNTTIDGNGETTIIIDGQASIQGFTITGGNASFGAGMKVSGDGTLIENNVFIGNQQSSGGYGAAIGGNSASPIINRNLFQNNSSDMQFLSGVVSFINGSEPVITNNIFENNQSRAINLTLPTGNHAKIINNTIVNNIVGIYIDRRVNTGLIEVRNNILVDNATGLHTPFGNEDFNPIFTNNLLWNNDITFENIAELSGIDGNLSADPLFTNSKFQISKDSPAIDAGSEINAPDHDFRGKSRPQDGNNDGIAITDIGAQEGGSLGVGILLLLIGGIIRKHQTRS